jgi:RHS repeat-associated protein
VRITRTGTSVSGYRSPDGVTWTLIASDTITFTQPTIYAGLAVTSHTNAAVSTATFTNVATTGWVTTASSPAYARGYVYGSYVDELLAILPSTGLAADRKFVHSNHLYSVAALTDNSGNVVERYGYSAYGERTVLAPDGTTTRTASLYGNQVGFTGRYLDKETGLWYFRERYYSGSLGRFVSRDPIGYADGLSLYNAYFIPNGVDPDGLTYWTILEGSRALGSVGLGFFAGHLSAEYRKCECPERVTVNKLYDTADIESTYKCKKIGEIELMPNRTHKAKHLESGPYRNPRTQPRNSPPPSLVWITRNVAFSEIKLNSKASELIPLEIFDDEPTAKAKWEAMVGIGTAYEYAEKSNWPKSIYQTLGNNSNTFIKDLLKKSSYSHQEGFSRTHPGHDSPVPPNNEGEWGPLMPR